MGARLCEFPPPRENMTTVISPPFPHPFRPVFIGGVHGRVGSTFLRRMLSAHPAVSAIGTGETRLIEYCADLEAALDPARGYNPQDAAIAVRAFRDHVSATLGSTPALRAPVNELEESLGCHETRLPGGVRMLVPDRVPDPDRHRAIGACVTSLLAAARLYPDREVGCEKTPSNAQYLDLIRTLLPDAPVVVLVRNPIHVALSHTQREWGPTDPVEAAQYTDAYFQRWKTVAASVPVGSYMIVRHEDLVAKPLDIASSIAAYLGIAPDPEWLDRIAREVRPPLDRLTSLTTRQRTRLCSILADSATDFGYEI